MVVDVVVTAISSEASRLEDPDAVRFAVADVEHTAGAGERRAGGQRVPLDPVRAVAARPGAEHGGDDAGVQVDAPDRVVLGVDDVEAAAADGEALRPPSVASARRPAVAGEALLPSGQVMDGAARRDAMDGVALAQRQIDRAASATAIARGPLSGVSASVAPSGVGRRSPVPPIVFIVPGDGIDGAQAMVADSQISSRPSGSIAMLWGWRSAARAAGPPSPENPGVPMPATVESRPVPASTLRTTWLSRSAMYRCPRPSNAISCGMFSEPAVAGPPSPP